MLRLLEMQFWMSLVYKLTTLQWLYNFMILDNSVSKVTSYKLDDQVSIPGTVKYISLRHHVMTHPGSWSFTSTSS
jgi:hypothetical protein